MTDEHDPHWLINDGYRWQVAVSVSPTDGEAAVLEAWLHGEVGLAFWIENEKRVLFATRDDADYFVRVWGGAVERLAELSGKTP